MQPPSQDPTNTAGQPSSSFSSNPSSQLQPDNANLAGYPYGQPSYPPTQPAPPPPPPPEDYPEGEVEYYRRLAQNGDGGPATRQHAGTGARVGTSSLPPKKNGWKIVSLLLLILVLLLGITTTVSFLTRPTSSQIGPTPVPIATQPVLQPTPTATLGSTEVTPTPGVGITATPSVGTTAALVPSGTITENLLLTCGANCNDPIRVTITTIQVNDADGNMIWNVSLKNVSGNSLNYGVGNAYSGDTFELLANGAQNQIPARFAQITGSLPNSDPVIIQGVFAFVPTQNTTYTLTVAITAPGQAQIAFDPVQITNL